ncbi:hypothetical protein ACXR0O_00180 [Verrucomicrobiota bacterium sgz303538]
MSFDLRLPIGLLFTLFGLILVGFGLLGPQEIYKQSLGINVNLWWGLVQLCFGVLMLFLALRRKNAPARPKEQ